MRRWRRWALAVACWCLTGAALGQGPDPEIQRAFIEGLQRLQSGDQAGAERIFRELLERTRSPRIKLELARTLFLRKEYRESRALFREVMLDPELPWRVRDNIEVFLRAIDDIEGYVRFSASVVSDSNPRNITSQREFTIGGVRLTFEPPQDNKRVTGLRYAVQAYRPLLPEDTLSGYFTGSYLDYPSSSLDRLTFDAGLLKGLGESGITQARAGLEAGTFGGKSLYEFPYVGLARRLLQSERYRVEGSLRFGRVNFPHADYLDADYGSVSLNGARELGPTLIGSLGGTLEVSEAREPPYSYYGVSVEPGVALLVTQPALLLKATVAYGERRYADLDPLFGVQRSDRRTAVELSVRSKEWRWMNFAPVLVVSLEHNRSNIDFYAYRKANLSVMLE